MQKLRRSKQEPVGSLGAFLEAVKKITTSWAPEWEFDPWFRGQGDADWDLLPRIHRPECKEIIDYEPAYRDDFERRAWPYLPSGYIREPHTPLEWYILMQHYRMPTRLLDWTESALIALYFAVEQAIDESKKKEGWTNNAAVWAMDPMKFNKKVGKVGEQILSQNDRRLKKYLPQPSLSRSYILPKHPIAFEPTHYAERIAAQKSVFTLHGSKPQALNYYAILSRHVKKIEIAHGHIKFASSIVKCNTWVSRKESAILSVYAKNLCSSYRNRA